MNSEAVQSVLAILIIGILAIVALYHGVDGQLYGLSIVAIAGLGGYEVYQRTKNQTPPGSKEEKQAP